MGPMLVGPRRVASRAEPSGVGWCGVGPRGWVPGVRLQGDGNKGVAPEKGAGDTGVAPNGVGHRGEAGGGPRG